MTVLVVRTTRGPVTVEDRPISDEARLWAEVLWERVRLDELYLVVQAILDDGAATARSRSPEGAEDVPAECAGCAGRCVPCRQVTG